MTHAMNIHDGTGILITVPGLGILMAHGATVPADSAQGYGIGCLFIQNDGNDGTCLYINEGTLASADFNAVPSTIADGNNISLGTSSGTKIGTSASQKLGFFNATPVVQPASADQAVAVAASGGDSPTEAEFNAVVTLLNRLRLDLVALGLIKGSA